VQKPLILNTQRHLLTWALGMHISSSSELFEVKHVRTASGSGFKRMGHRWRQNSGVKAEDFRRAEMPQARPQFVDACPFCPGNEDLTPSEFYALWDEHQNHWEMRVVPDKSPVVARQGNAEPNIAGLDHRIHGVGRHDVIIETPDHSSSLHAYPVAHLEELLRIYRACHGIMNSSRQIEHVTIFRNHGANANSAVDHPHSQILGTPVVPGYVALRLAEAMHFYQEFGRCLFCALMEKEVGQGVRVVGQSKHFVAIMPFAGPSPFVTHIYPRRHIATFGSIYDDEIRDMAQLLKSTLAKFYLGLNDPDYSLTIRTAPKGHEGVVYFHWYVSIVPHLNRANGVERASVIPVNPIYPEDAAAFLNQVEVQKEQPLCLAV
jgi:UDPglucose--hexose-1-phosphate uridylyltransferase